jgi:hypothetical protein
MVDTRKVRLVCGPEGAPNFCFGLYDVATDECVTFVQSDWDYAGLASRFGWTPAEVQRCKPRDGFLFRAECGAFVCTECREPLYPMEVCHDDSEYPGGECPECCGPVEPLKVCDHDGTDGTVDCRACGVTASALLASAYDWLAARDGEEIECSDYD